MVCCLPYLLSFLFYNIKTLEELTVDIQDFVVPPRGGWYSDQAIHWEKLPTDFEDFVLTLRFSSSSSDIPNFAIVILLY